MAQAGGENLPRIYYFGSVATTMETAWQLAAEGKLDIWDSVSAREQSEGRGQLRRRWDSPEGNLYASIRLPVNEPFDSTAASVALGAMCAAALAPLGCAPWLKWPNDLVLPIKGRMAKFAGILLEERQGMLIGGIGININGAPEKLRPGAALPAASLRGACGGQWPTPRELWRSLVKNMLEVYKDAAFFAEHWHDMAGALLLWRGDQVEIADGSEMARGIFRGIGANGCALLETAAGVQEICSGSMRPA